MATVNVTYPNTVGPNYKTNGVLIGELIEAFDAGIDQANLSLYSKTKSDYVGNAYATLSANGFNPAAAWVKVHSTFNTGASIELALSKSGSFNYLKYDWAGLSFNGTGPSINEFTNDYLMGGGSPSSSKLPTQAAVKNWVDRQGARGYAIATTTNISTTGTWIDINSMSVNADFSGSPGGDVAYVHFSVTGYISNAATNTNWQVRVLVNGLTVSFIQPQVFVANNVSNVSTVSGVARFIGLNAANHNFKVQAILNNAATLIIGDTVQRGSSMLVTGG